MKTVGVRDLKNRLSEYLRAVRGGEGVLVTDRGEVIAELNPPGHHAVDPAIPPGLAALARRGDLRLATRRGPGKYPTFKPVRGPHTSADLLNDTRGER